MMIFSQVSLPVVRRFVQAVSDQAVGTGLIRGVKPDQQLVKVRFIFILFFSLFQLKLMKHSIGFFRVLSLDPFQLGSDTHLMQKALFIDSVLIMGK